MGLETSLETPSLLINAKFWVYKAGLFITGIDG